MKIWQAYGEISAQRQADELFSVSKAEETDKKESDLEYSEIADEEEH